MATIALFFGIAHYPMVRLGRTFSSFQIRSGTIGFMIFLVLMVLALIFMSNWLLKHKIFEKLRLSSFVMRFRYNVNKVLHNIMMFGIFVIFIHALIAFTSNSSVLMRSVYSFFFGITFIGWVYHKFIRRFRSESDPFIHRKASWDVVVSEFIPEANKKWAFTLIKQNPSLYPCLQCGSCTEQCAVSEVTKGDYNPRRNILGARFGYKDFLLGGEDLIIWGCTTCNTCEEVCPQNIELTETFTFLKNQSIAQGKGPNSIYEQMRMIFENAKAIPMQPAIENRRNQLSLPAILTPDINEVQTLLRNLGIDRKFQPR
jgi:heterodisulfide reductase subunit C